MTPTFDCARFEELLFERLEGRLDAAAAERLRRHAAGCGRCRELEALACGDAVLPAVEPPADLLARILERTSGARARALARLDEELPSMAEMEPDAGFVAAVMAATAGARRLSFWERLVLRPRLPLESAWAASLALVLLVGPPTSWSGEVPRRWLDEIREERVAVEREMTAGLQRLADDRLPELAEAGRRTWTRSATRLGGYVLPAGVRDTAGSLASTSRRFASSALDRAGGAWQSASETFSAAVRAVWQRLTPADPITDDEPTGAFPDADPGPSFEATDDPAVQPRRDP